MYEGGEASYNADNVAKVLEKVSRLKENEDLANRLNKLWGEYSRFFPNDYTADGSAEHNGEHPIW